MLAYVASTKKQLDNNWIVLSLVSSRGPTD